MVWRGPRIISIDEGRPGISTCSATTGQPTTRFGYDGHGDTTAITTAGSTTTTLSYDSQERPLTITTLSRSGVQSVYLSYNTAGQRLTYSVYQGSTRQRGEQYTYRADGQLGQVAVLSGTTGYTDTYLYDFNGAPLELLSQTEAPRFRLARAAMRPRRYNRCAPLSPVRLWPPAQRHTMYRRAWGGG